jgi:ABC-type oligopeptide transport system ATPase subunit
MSELLRIDNLSKTFSINAGGFFSKPLKLKALQDISFTVERGETLGIVGESGCGKSTLGRCILQLLKPDEGRVLWLGTDLNALPRRGDAEAPQGPPDHLPGSAGVAQSADDRGRDRGRSAQDADA